MELIIVNRTPISPASLASILEERYATLQAALTAQSSIEVQLFEAEQRLADARGKVLRENASDPKALGVNEAVREATLADRTRGERTLVAELEAQRLCLRHNVEVCRLRVEEGRAYLRLLEVNTGMQQ